MIRFGLPCLVALLAATPACAGSATLAASGARSVTLWTDGLMSGGDDADRLVGFAFEREGGALRWETRVGVQQHANPGTRDTGKAIWALSGAPNVSDKLRFDWRSEGALDSLGGVYTQNLTGALVWTARRTSDFTSSLSLKSDLAFDVTGATRSVSLGPEWVLSLRHAGPLAQARAELRAGVEYRTPSDGPPSAAAMVELRLFQGE